MYIHEEIQQAVLPFLKKYDLELIDLIGELNMAAWKLSVLSKAGLEKLLTELEVRNVNWRIEMSEDELREQFETWWISGEVKLPVLVSEHSMFFADQAWLACAKIKDAEIEQLNVNIAGWKCSWQESTDREIELNKEIERLQNLLTHNVER
jgi:hypothetical protein